MKQVFKYASLLFVAGALLVTSCSKKKDDDAVTPTPEPTPTCAGGSVKSLTYDVSAANPYGTGTQENASVAVSKCDGSYNIVIKADNDDDLDYLYILKSTDGGEKKPVKLSDVTDGNGNKWTGNSSSYTLKAPGSGDKKKFTLTVNIPVREAENGTDAYEVWFTNASGIGNGRFSQPKAKRDIGPVLASFNYGSIKYSTTSFTAEVGSQNNSKPSYVITTGIGGTLTLEDIVGTAATPNADSANEFASVNMLFYVLNTTLDARSTTTPALVSPDQRSALGYTRLVSGGSVTTFAEYTGSFSSAGETELKALSPSAKSIAIQASKVYSFKTTDAKTGKISVGLAQINSISGTGDNRTANVTFKVLNVGLAAVAAAAAVEAK